MVGRKRTDEEGFSLLEVLISLVILAVGLLALALFQVTAIKGNSIASKWTTATQLTQERLENFRHAPWAGISSSPAAAYDTGTMRPQYANIVANAGDNVLVPGTGTRYYRAWFVNNDSATLRTITVWTCWQDDQSNWHNVMFTTQRANMGGV
ncbi:MAG: prepilin-type N-terminal cleavage/methylation domain-containing protein [Deltaproteobacteria bacterium]|nr:prepilin-type N-terminal cleavage/methylation domain-containing protein [Deltaproteobacteria bacterium]